MGYKLYFTQTEHETQVWGDLDGDWAEQMRESYARFGGGEHALVDDPGRADIVLFWEPHQDSQVIWAPRLRAHPLVGEFPNKVFVVSVEDFPLGFLPGLYCSLSKRLFDPRRHRTWVYHRTPNRHVNSYQVSESQCSPQQLASFMGGRSHPIRVQLFEESAGLASHGLWVRETPWNRYGRNPTAPEFEGERLAYVEAILSAKFSLCPRGNGPSSYRIQESLALGRSPVIISDEWVPVQGPDWHSFAVFVKERHIGLLPRILRQYEPYWREMGQAAQHVYQTWFAQEHFAKRAVNQIVALYRNRTHDEREFISGWDKLIEAERYRRAAA